MNRKDAYKCVYEAIGEETFTDRKGAWTAEAVIRKTHSDREDVYDFYVRFKADPKAAPKAACPFSHKTLRVFLRSTEGIEQLKHRIRSEAGYTPATATVTKLWDHFWKLHEAYREEDRAYAEADKAAAAAVLDALFEKAVARANAGECFVSEDRLHYSRLAIERYLTREEQDEAQEAQKVLNGHAHVEYMSQYGRSGHLVAFNQRIEEEVERLNKIRERVAYQDREQKLMGMLESDVPFRKLVAHAVAASKVRRSKHVEYELAQRLFGYVRNLDEYRKIYRMIDETLRTFELASYEASKLVELGRQYLKEGGMLPAVTAPFERDPNKHYFGDIVHNGRAFYEVAKAGQQYIYLSGGQRLEKKDVFAFEPADPIEQPQTFADFLYNEGVRMHNIQLLPQAYLLSVSELARRLWVQTHRPRELLRIYQTKQEKETAPQKKAAYQRILDELRMIQLGEQIDSLKGLATVGAYKEVYAKASGELETLRARYKG